MHRRCVEHSSVQRIGVLNALIVEQLDAKLAVARPHFSKLIGGNGRSSIGISEVEIVCPSVLIKAVSRRYVAPA